MSLATAEECDLEPLPWHSLSAEEALSQLGSTPNGLSAEEAAQRLAFIHLAFWLQES